MSDIDVALRLRLKNELSRESQRADRDLKHLATTAKELGRAGSGMRLDKELAEVSREAGRSGKALRELDREARRLNNVKTDAAEREINALRKASERAERQFQEMNRSVNGASRARNARLGELAEPTKRLGGAFDFLKTSAGGAFSAMLAFASVDNIIRGMERLSEQARKLDRDVASVAVTAEMRNPETVQRIGTSNERLALRYGMPQGAVNDARKAYAAAGFGLEQQEDILDPTLKAAKGEDSTGVTLSAAVIAAQQNLGVKNGEVPLALDYMAKGAKLGSFEVDAMAKDFPSLASQYAQTGRTGLPALGELVALAQVVRMGAGTQDEAATNLQNLIAKVSAPDTIKNFKEAGVDLADVRRNSEKTGTPYLVSVVDLVQKLTGGDSMKIGELFGDMQAKQALAPLLSHRQDYIDFLKQITEGSAGTVDADYQFLQSTPEERQQRRDAAMEAVGNKTGRVYDAVVSPIKDWFLRKINPQYGNQEAGRERRETLSEVDLGELRQRIAEMEARLAAMPKSVLPDFDALAMPRQTLEQEIQQLRLYEQEVQRVQAPPPGAAGQPANGALPKPQAALQSLDQDLSAAAEKSMQSYNDKLDAGGDQAVSIARQKADAIKGAFEFTATPTIAPTFLPPSSAPAAPSDAKGKQSSLQQSSSVQLAQHFHGNANPRLAAMRAQREQNRAVRMAMARSLSDTGYRLS